jgi:multidrug resistance efflux pump
MALIENADFHFRIATVEAQVKAARANVSRLKTQVEIARSMSASVRSSMEL